MSSTSSRPDMVVDGVVIAPVQPIAVSIRTAADIVNLSERTMSTLISRGEIVAPLVGTRRLVPVAELSRWLSQKTETLRAQKK